MIDTNRYEGCQTDRPLVLHKGLLCPTVFMDVDGSGEIVPTLDRGIVDVQADIPDHYLALLQDAPLLLEQVKILTRTLELIGKNMKHDPWIQNLIKETTGYEKWQAKELIE